MEKELDTTKTENKAGAIVTPLIEAINKLDLKTARDYVSDDFKFVGALGSRDGADAYFKDMEQMQLNTMLKRHL